MTAVFRRKQPVISTEAKPATEAVWSSPNDTMTYREEVREFEGLKFTVVRRSLTFTEETRILTRVINPQTKRPDTLELLALTVQTAVKSSDFGLTPEKVRTSLSERPSLAWFFIKWLCAETLANIGQGSEEELTKKSGP